MVQGIDHLIINSPFGKPKQYWKYDREERFFKLVEGRRPAGYLSSSNSKSFDDPGTFHELPLVNKIRKNVDEWRNNNYPGVTGMTKELLEYWTDKDQRHNTFFFCQIEAIETLIWLKEILSDQDQIIKVPSDGGPFKRLCCKMATGTGKTIVMGLLIVWQTLNNITYPNDNRFSNTFLLVAPGLTVKKRLEVLDPSHEQNIYKEFNIVPRSLYRSLSHCKIILHNWHTLMPIEENINSVVKKGKESHESFTRRIIGDMSASRNLVIINDEAHHAWRTKPGLKINATKEEIEKATRWIEGLDRIHNARHIIECYDFSATPFIPSKNFSEDNLYEWIISDFSLNDAIESGLVKTPRIAIRDDGRFSKDYHSRFYHIYPDSEVKEDINRKAMPEDPLPALIKNAYFVLGNDWLETKRKWEKLNSEIPPVMITICNRTETAARIDFAFRNNMFGIEELGKNMLHIDSKVLDKAETNLNDKSILDYSEDIEEEEWLREKVSTVGKIGLPGQNIQNIIAVQMLSEGWDAKNVTHVLGLRAFTSQLLCEQVVGRGLRRTTYEIDPETGFFHPEYVNIFGIPFTFLPIEGSNRITPPPTKPATLIKIFSSKKQYEISWPNITRLDRSYRPTVFLNWNLVEPLVINPEETATLVDLAPTIEGKPHVDKIATIDMENEMKKFRLQNSVFVITKQIYETIKPSWRGNKEYLLFQIVKIVDRFVQSEKLLITNNYYNEGHRKRALITFNVKKIIQHIWNAIYFQNIESTELIFDTLHPIGSTNDMYPWYTTKPTEYVKKSHVNHAVVDSKWELTTVFELERNKDVMAWVKNDHLGFEIDYIFEKVAHKYIPDFLIKLSDEKMLILEIKGINTDKEKVKRKYLEEWVNAVNEDGRFGKWVCDVVYEQSQIRDIIRKHT